MRFTQKVYTNRRQPKADQKKTVLPVTGNKKTTYSKFYKYGGTWQVFLQVLK